MADTHSGGCQCGAVRYRIAGELGRAGFCHCRMCQKANGNFGMALITIPVSALTWSRGKPATFRSSAVVDRGFCRACGTPLFMHEDGDDNYEITVGSLDDPAAAPPELAVGLESKLPWADSIASLPGHSTADDRTPEDMAKLVNRQHPDHDTDNWTPQDQD